MNLTDTSTLIVHRETNALGMRKAFNYEWSGDSPYMSITGSLYFQIYPDVRKEIQIGSYKLLLIEYRFDTDTLFYVRADKLGWLRILIYKATRTLDCDIHIVKKVKKLWS